jgi:hypothetical protein
VSPTPPRLRCSSPCCNGEDHCAGNHIFGMSSGTISFERRSSSTSRPPQPMRAVLRAESSGPMGTAIGVAWLLLRQLGAEPAKPLGSSTGTAHDLIAAVCAALHSSSRLYISMHCATLLRVSTQAQAAVGIESGPLSLGGLGMPYKPEDLLTEQQLADELRKSPATLARWRRIGTGPPWLRVGKTPMYRWGDVLRWLAQQEGS